MPAPWKKSYEKPRQLIKKQRHHRPQSLSSQSYGFSSSHVQMWQLDHKEGWAPKKWCFQSKEKALESSFDCKESKPVNPKGNQSWIFIGRTDAEAEAPILWPLDVIGQLTGKDLDVEKVWRQEKGTTEAGWWDGIMDWMDTSLSKLREMVKDREGWCAAVHGSQRVRHNWVTATPPPTLALEKKTG